MVSWAKITDISDPKAVKGEIFFHSPSPFRGEGVPDRVGVGEGKNLNLHLYPALIRSERFEWMLEKVTELGVSFIHPIFTERTIVRIPSSHFDAKIKRWQKIILSAGKQCGVSKLPDVSSPLHFNEAIQQCTKAREWSPRRPSCKNDSINLILWEGEEKNPLSDIFRSSSLVTRHLSRPSINLFIGPEGGFTIEEANEAKNAGIKSVRLGENILRAETAAIAAVSLILMI